MRFRIMVIGWFSKVARTAVLGTAVCVLIDAPVTAQEGNRTSVRAQTADTAPLFLSFARLKIPFNVEAKNSDLDQVQLWVSTDLGQTWQMHGTAQPQADYFDFKAAAEGLYLFSVQTVDKLGMAYPSQSPPLKVMIDTSKPEAAIRADINATGQLVVDVRVMDENLDLSTAALRVRTDREPQWSALPLGSLVDVNGIHEGQAVMNLPTCREVALAFVIEDRAKNSGEATFLLTMPRTASGDPEMTLASTGLGGGRPFQQGGGNTASLGVPTLPGAVAWQPADVQPRGTPAPSPTQSRNSGWQSPGRLASGSNELALEPSAAGERASMPEELPMPKPVATSLDEPAATSRDETPEANTGSASDIMSFGRAFHCKSRAFSLDYSVEALGGSTLSEVELWGTEDGGRTWQQWGSDPDRTSPFDVQVGNDGLFGHRMVIVGANGLVSNRPKDGDSADVWINVDTDQPAAKITRAVYGQGSEDGMLVIDYTCQDSHLVDRPVTLSYSERIDGPWSAIATGQKNTGIYLWKADPNLPERIYLRIEAIDKAGNVGTHRLDLPIDTKGLAPRGRIQGFRPILEPVN